MLESLGQEPFSWGGNDSITNPGEIRQQYISALRAADIGDITPLMIFSRQ